MQGFSRKYYPRRAGDFRRKQEAWPCFPVQSRNYLCAQNENDWLMRLTERRKMEVNETRGRLGRKNFRGKSVKKRITKRKKTSPEAWKGQTTTKEVWLFPIRRNLFSRVATIILPGLSGCVWAPVSFMGQADTLCIHFPLPAKETAKKEKSFENP